MTRTHHFRLGLLAVGTLLALLTTIQPGHSQPGPPGGIRGGPPFGPPAGIGGGIGGRPPGFPQPPAIPQPPNIPQPPIAPWPAGFGGGHGIGGGMGGIGGGTTQWRCGRCGMVLATGPTPPAQIVCPRCQTTNVPPGTPLPPGGGIAPPPGVNPPVTPVPVQPGDGNDQGVPGAGILPPPLEPGVPARVDPLPPQDGLFAPASDSSSSAPSRGALVLRVVLITLGVLLLLAVGIAGVVFAVVKNNQAARRRRPRRRRRYKDDDY